MPADIAPPFARPSGYFKAPFGQVAIYDDGHLVHKLSYLPQVDVDVQPTHLTHEVKAQLTAYLESSGFRFDLPLAPQGTRFQLRVWQALSEIPVGSVQSYSELADRLGSAARAVGGACRRNPLPWIVPCHRIVSKTGIGGFAGATDGALIDVKSWLLKHEGAI
ncbi:methylated-DNA--[protein]-cysteine S-methyltransferase [Corallincola platygyrae]|uniref:Methylated-DNA--[protein]-cysteine S-methyltransferase n=1 Tax=Corallincola platygyrae TaxID=1193278 RepID=A0ABW4XLU6_9GAMM